MRLSSVNPQIDWSRSAVSFLTFGQNEIVIAVSPRSLPSFPAASIAGESLVSDDFLVFMFLVSSSARSISIDQGDISNSNPYNRHSLLSESTMRYSTALFSNCDHLTKHFTK